MFDYKNSGMTICAAMVDQSIKSKNTAMKYKCIRWGDEFVFTSDVLAVPESGVVTATFLRCNSQVEQGFDLKVDGWIELEDGTQLQTLRTWYDEKYENVVKYRYFSKSKELRTWNVYRVKLKNGLVLEEKWGGNAGFLVEKISDLERVYYCSHGCESQPDFNDLVYSIKIDNDF